MNKHETALNKANSWIKSADVQIESTPYRLNYHFMAPTGWMNDPNGFIQYNGDYHLFYQFNPYHSSWGPIHWGHAVSKDLMHWQHLPVALAPSETYDRSDNDIHGCASGTAVIQDGELVLFYTGHGIGNHPMQVQCAARSQDGIHFEKIPENPVVAEVPDSCSEDFRDPKIFRLDDQWYMVIGTKKDEIGKLALYASNDLTYWDYCGILVEGDGHQGEMWECPDLFDIGQSDILIISPIKDRVNQNPFALFGHFDREKKRFESFGSQILDYGVDFYAPQTMQDDHGRRVLIAWMDNWLTPKPSQPFGWAGAMTIPRELTIGEDGKLRQNPVREVAALRDRYIAYHSFQIDRDSECFGSCSNSSEIIAEIDLDGTTATRFGLKVRCSLAQNEETEILVNTKTSTIALNRAKSGAGDRSMVEAPIHLVHKERLVIRVFLDVSSIEIFLNDGDCVLTNRIYPDASSQGIGVFSLDGMVDVDKLEIWNLKAAPIWKCNVD